MTNRLKQLREDRGDLILENLTAIAITIVLGLAVSTATAWLVTTMVKVQQANSTVSTAVLLNGQWNKDVHSASAVEATSNKTLLAYSPTTTGTCQLISWQIEATKINRVVSTYPTASGNGSTYRCTGVATVISQVPTVLGDSSSSTIAFTNQAGRALTFAANRTPTLAAGAAPTGTDTADWAAPVVKRATLTYVSPPTIFGASRTFALSSFLRGGTVRYNAEDLNEEAVIPVVATPAAPVVNPTDPLFAQNYRVSWTGICPTGTALDSYEVTQNDVSWVGNSLETNKTVVAPASTASISYKVRVLCRDGNAVDASPWSLPGVATPKMPPAVAEPTNVGLQISWGSPMLAYLDSRGDCTNGSTPVYNFAGSVEGNDRLWGTPSTSSRRTFDNVIEGSNVWAVTAVYCETSWGRSADVFVMAEQTRAVTSPTPVTASIYFASNNQGVVTAWSSCQEGATLSWDFATDNGRVDNGWRGRQSNNYHIIGNAYEGSTMRALSVARCEGAGGRYSGEARNEMWALRSISPPQNLELVQEWWGDFWGVQTATGANCAEGTVGMYSFQHRVNSGATSPWSAWQTGNQEQFAWVYAGDIYEGSVVAYCKGYSIDSVGIQKNGSVRRTISAPAAPTSPYTSDNGTAAYKNNRIVWTRVACPSGTTDEYRVRRERDETGYAADGLATGSWGAVSLTGDKAYYNVSSTKAGVHYTWSMQARCNGSTGPSLASTWSADNDWRTEMPIAKPAVPNVSATTLVAGGTVTVAWSSPCPSTTTTSAFDVNRSGTNQYDGTAGSDTYRRTTAGSETFYVRAKCQSADGYEAWSDWSNERTVTWSAAPVTPTPVEEPKYGVTNCPIVPGYTPQTGVGFRTNAYSGSCYWQTRQPKRDASGEIYVGQWEEWAPLPYGTKYADYSG